MLIDVSNLKDVERVSSLVKECYLKALCDDKVITECVDVLLASNDLVRLVGSLPAKPNKLDIIKALLRGQKLDVYFVNSRAKSPEEMETISNFFTVYQRFLERIDTFTIDNAVKSGADISNILKELSLYEVDERAIFNKVSRGSAKCANTEPLKSKCQKLEGMKHHPLNEYDSLEIEEKLSNMVDAIIGSKILKDLCSNPIFVPGCGADPTEPKIKSNKELVESRLQKFKDENITTVMVKSIGSTVTFIFHRDGVIFEFPLSIKALKPFRSELSQILDPQILKGYYHTRIIDNGVDKQVHVGLTGKNQNAIYFQVRATGETKGKIFTIHLKSQLLKQFIILLDEAINIHESKGNC